MATESLTAAQALKELETTAAEELTDAQAVALADDLAYPELTEAQENELFADDEPRPLPPPCAVAKTRPVRGNSQFGRGLRRFRPPLAWNPAASVFESAETRRRETKGLEASDLSLKRETKGLEAMRLDEA